MVRANDNERMEEKKSARAILVLLLAPRVLVQSARRGFPRVKSVQVNDFK